MFHFRSLAPLKSRDFTTEVVAAESVLRMGLLLMLVGRTDSAATGHVYDSLVACLSIFSMAL